MTILQTTFVFTQIAENANLLANIGVDRAENEPPEILKFGCRPILDAEPCTPDLQPSNRTSAV